MAEEIPVPTISRHQDYISKVRKAAKTAFDAIQDLKALQPEAAYGGYSATLQDGQGTNAGITRADVLAVVGTTADALDALLDAGHGTNLVKIL